MATNKPPNDQELNKMIRQAQDRLNNLRDEAKRREQIKTAHQRPR